MGMSTSHNLEHLNFTEFQRFQLQAHRLWGFSATLAVCESLVLGKKTLDRQKSYNKNKVKYSL